MTIHRLTRQPTTRTTIRQPTTRTTIRQPTIRTTTRQLVTHRPTTRQLIHHPTTRHPTTRQLATHRPTTRQLARQPFLLMSHLRLHPALALPLQTLGRLRRFTQLRPLPLQLKRRQRLWILRYQGYRPIVCMS